MTRLLTLMLLLGASISIPQLADAQIVADFSTRLMVNPACVSLTASTHFMVRDLSTGPVKKWNWFANSPAVTISMATPNAPIITVEAHKGEVPETFLLTLIASGDEGSDTVSKTITAGFHFAPLPNPHPMRFVEGCAPLSVEFTAKASSVHGDDMIAAYEWDFGENGQTITDVGTIHAYTTPGTYMARLIVTDKTGCSGGGDWQDPVIKILVKGAEACN